MAEKAVESVFLRLRSIEMGTYEFVVENFSRRCKGIGVGNLIESEEFDLCGYRWAILFYPEGKELDAYNGGFASCYITLMSESSSAVRCLYEFYVLDQSGKGDHLCLSLFRCEFPKGIPCLKLNTYSGYRNFVDRKLVESSNYLKDDCLRIRATIGVLMPENRVTPLIKVQDSKIGADFRLLLESKQWVDVFFKVSGESFCAHKCILAAHSSVFHALFSDAHQQQGEIVIIDMEPGIFKAMLWFIYTGNLLEEKQESLDASGQFVYESFLGKMVAAADKFGLKSLKHICESRIWEGVCLRWAPRVLHPDRDGAPQLKAASLKLTTGKQDASLQLDGDNNLHVNSQSLSLELLHKKDCRPQIRFYTWKDTFLSVKEYLAAVDKPWKAICKKWKIKVL